MGAEFAIPEFVYGGGTLRPANPEVHTATPPSEDAAPRGTAAETPAMDVLFVGGVFPQDEEAAILKRSKGPVQNAANALQWALIRGLDAALGKPVSLLNAVFVGAYPRLYRDSWIHGRRWSHAPGAHDESVAFLNLFGVKHVWRTVSLSRALLRWAEARRTERRSIVAYSMHMPFMVAAAVAKSVDRSIRVCLIVPDLPEHMNPSGDRGWLFRALKAIDRWIIGWAARRVDAFVLLTRHMAEPLAVGDRPWIVMEGAVEPDLPPDTLGSVTRDPEKVVLYTGTLAKAYGIGQLLDAFALISDPDCRLWICGAGDAEDEVRAVAARDMRVRFIGQVSRAEAMLLQRRATVLVNPRGEEGEFTKYSFPSKLLEYLLSGTPAIVKRLPGMPEQYCEYFFVVDGPSTADLAAKIREVCGKSLAEREEFGRRARQFVVEQKSGIVQARRIVELLARN